MTKYIFILSLTICIFPLTMYILYIILPKFYFRYRLKSLFSKPQKKSDTKREIKINKRWVQIIFSILEKQIQASNLPITAQEFGLVIIWGNILVLFTSIWSIPISLILLCFINLTVFILLKYLKNRRRKQMIEQLPDVLQLISNALKAGYSFVQTIELVSKENSPPLSKEFGKLYQTLHYGESFEVALTTFKQRMDIEEITSMVDTLLITKETGGNVTIVVDNLLRTMSENIQLLGALKSITAQGRMTAWVIGSLPTSLFFILYFLSPEYMKLLFNHPIGIAITILAFVLQGIGILLIIRIVKLKVR